MALPDGLYDQLLTDSLARSVAAVGADRADVVALNASAGEALAEALQKGDRGRVLALDPTTANRMMNSLARQIERCAAHNLQPVVLCSAPVRPALKKLADRFIPNLFVLSYDEILSTVDVRSLGSVELSDAD